MDNEKNEVHVAFQADEYDGPGCTYDNVSDPPSAKAAPVWVPTGDHGTLHINTVPIPNCKRRVACTPEAVSPNLGRQRILAEVQETNNNNNK